MADKNIDLEKLWEKQGWSFRGTGDKKESSWGFSLGSGDGAFCFNSQHRPPGPPLFIEAKKVFAQMDAEIGRHPTGVLVLWGFAWDTTSGSLEDCVERYQRLLAGVKIPPKEGRSETQVSTSSGPATDTRESLNKRLFKENLSNQIKIQTIQMAINLGLLKR